MVKEGTCMPKERLTNSELQVMNILWDMNHHASTNEVLERYDAPKPAYNTVSTILTRLSKKGFVAYSKQEGKTYYYYPLLTKARYALSLQPQYRYLRTMCIVGALMFSAIVVAVCISNSAFVQRIRESIENILMPRGEEQATKHSVTNKHNDARPEPSMQDEVTVTMTKPKQDKTTDAATMQDDICNNPSQQPEFRGGDAALASFVSKNKTITDRKGRIYLRLLINNTGMVKSAEAITDESTDMELANEAVRLAYTMPEWMPARYEGKGVSTYIIIPIVFE